METVILKKGKEINIERRHPWIFSGALKRLPHPRNAGLKVKVADYKDNILAVGHYNNGSIAVRVLDFENITIDQSWWNTKIKNAYSYRQNMGLVNNESTNAYRLIHGEGDGIPGLIVDIYDRSAIIQFHSLGCYNDREAIAKAIDLAYEGELVNIYLNTKNLKEAVNNNGGELYKGSGQLSNIKENNIQFQVDWIEGQKTGFFLDQRENRKLVGELAKGKSVLNCFCYTGGFSNYAIAGGATKVHSIDISSSATDMVRKNHDLNNFNNDIHTIETSNVMKTLPTLDEYDLVIIDPPAFAKSVKKRHNAVQAYKRLNALALQKVKSGGYLFTFSCSQVVGPELFNNTVAAAAIEVKRNIRIIHRLTQGPDHPVSIYHPEGNYLKGLVLYVE